MDADAWLFLASSQSAPDAIAAVAQVLKIHIYIEVIMNRLAYKPNSPIEIAFNKLIYMYKKSYQTLNNMNDNIDTQEFYFDKKIIVVF